MKLLFVMLLSVLFCSCTSKESSSTLLNKVRSEHLKEMWEKHQMEPNMTGGGGENKKLNLICLGLDTKKPLTIKTGRRLLLSSVQDLMERVNAYQKFHPYLSEVPFGYDKYSYSIDVVDKNKFFRYSIKQPEPKNISYVILKRGKVCYKIFSLETDKIETIYCEPYEEALKIIEEENRTNTLE